MASNEISDNHYNIITIINFLYKEIHNYIKFDVEYKNLTCDLIISNMKKFKEKNIDLYNLLKDKVNDFNLDNITLDNFKYMLDINLKDLIEYGESVRVVLLHIYFNKFNKILKNLQNELVGSFKPRGKKDMIDVIRIGSKNKIDDVLNININYAREYYNCLPSFITFEIDKAKYKKTILYVEIISKLKNIYKRNLTVYILYLHCNNFKKNYYDGLKKYTHIRELNKIYTLIMQFIQYLLNRDNQNMVKWEGFINTSINKISEFYNDKSTQSKLPKNIDKFK